MRGVSAKQVLERDSARTQTSQKLALWLVNNLVGAREGRFCDSIGIFDVVRILNDRVPGPCHHSFSPWREESKLTVLLCNHRKAHLYADWSIGQPPISGPGADRSFISSGKGSSGNKKFLISGFRTAIPNHHVVRFCRRTLRLLAFSFDHRDDDFSRLGGPCVDWFRLAGQSGSPRVICSLKIGGDIDIFLGERALDQKIDAPSAKAVGKQSRAKLGLVVHLSILTSRLPVADILPTTQPPRPGFSRPS